jgi:hypothetical protein
VSVSNHSSSHKKTTSSKSNPNSATPETAAAPAIAPSTSAPVSAPVSTPPPEPSALSKLATASIAQLDALETKLDLNIVVAPNDKAQRRSLARVTDTAIALAADIVGAAPERFPDFASLPSAAAYVETMGPLADRAVELGVHLQKSVQNQRTPAALQTLSFYAVAKGLGRMTGNETMREKVQALKAEVAPKRVNPKPKETKGQKAAKRSAKAQADKIAKLQTSLAKLTGGSSGGTPVSLPTPAPAASVAAPSATVPALAPATAPSVQPAEAAPVASPATNGVPVAPLAAPASH